MNFNVPNAPNFTFDNRLVDQGEAWLSSVRSNVTWIRGSHSLKGGLYFEQSRNSEGNGGVGAGPVGRAVHVQHRHQQSRSTPTTATPTRCIGSFSNYTEIDAFSEVRAPQHRGVLPAGHVEGQPPR